LASSFSSKVLASKGFYRSKFAFVASIHFRQSQVSEIGFSFSAKVSASLVQAFLSGSFFSGKVHFWQSQFLAKVSASPGLWRFSNSVLASMAKSGL